MQGYHPFPVEQAIPEFVQLIAGHGVTTIGTTRADDILLFVDGVDQATARTLAERVKTEWKAREVMVVKNAPEGESMGVIWSTDRRWLSRRPGWQCVGTESS